MIIIKPFFFLDARKQTQKICIEIRRRETENKVKKPDKIRMGGR